MTRSKEHANRNDICYVADETADDGQYQPFGAQQPASPPCIRVATSILIVCVWLLLGPMIGHPLLKYVPDQIHNRQIRIAV